MSNGDVRIHSLEFSLEGRAWQEPEPSHVASMALAHFILGTFLGVVCHCFPPPLDIPTLASREILAAKGGTVGEKDFHLNLGIFYTPQIYDMGPTALLPLRRKAC